MDDHVAECVSAAQTDRDTVLLPSEVADRLELDEHTVLALLTSGVLPGCRLAGRWRIYWPAVLARFHDPAGDVLRTPALAARLGLTESTVLRLLAAGALPGKKLGKQWFCWWPAVIAALSSRNGDAAEQGGDP